MQAAILTWLNGHAQHFEEHIFALWNNFNGEIVPEQTLGLSNNLIGSLDGVTFAESIK